MLTFSFTGAAGEMTVLEVLTTGMVGKPVRFIFSPEWEGLRKNAVYQAGTLRRVHLDVGETDVIPWEVLEKPLVPLTVGIWGTSPDGQVVIPTIRVPGPKILPGVSPDGDPGVEASLPVWAQLQAMIGDLSLLETDENENLVAALNEVSASGGGGGGTAGQDGVTFTPSVSQDGILSWTNDGGLENPAPVDITGPQGEQGNVGPQGEKGEQGDPGSGIDVSGAAVGQIAKISAVDENGVPTAWAPADLPTGGSGSSWELVADITLEEDISTIYYSDLNAKELQFAFFGRFNDADDAMSNANQTVQIILSTGKPGYGTPSSAPHFGYVRASGFDFLTIGEVKSVAGFESVKTEIHGNSNAATAAASGGRRKEYTVFNELKLYTGAATTFFKAGGRFVLYKKA